MRFSYYENVGGRVQILFPFEGDEIVYMRLIALDFQEGRGVSVNYDFYYPKSYIGRYQVVIQDKVVAYDNLWFQGQILHLEDKREQNLLYKYTSRQVELTRGDLYLLGNQIEDLGVKLNGAFQAIQLRLKNLSDRISTTTPGDSSGGPGGSEPGSGEGLSSFTVDRRFNDTIIPSPRPVFITPVYLAFYLNPGCRCSIGVEYMTYDDLLLFEQGKCLETDPEAYNEAPLCSLGTIPEDSWVDVLGVALEDSLVVSGELTLFTWEDTPAWQAQCPEPYQHRWVNREGMWYPQCSSSL